MRILWIDSVLPKLAKLSRSYQKAHIPMIEKSFYFAMTVPGRYAAFVLWTAVGDIRQVHDAGRRRTSLTA